MGADKNIQIADVRDIFIQWNKSQLENMLDNKADDYQYIKLIAFFLQLNNKLLPGYSGPDTPVGVYGYEADKSTINTARQLNSKFRYQREGIIKNSAVEAVILQKKTVDASLLCWIFIKASISGEKLLKLEDKIKKIAQWLITKNIEIEIICTTHEKFTGDDNDKIFSGNKALFLDEFYSELILLAGKYPVWWLVPCDKEKEYALFVEHIKQARFVDNDEFIDLGSVVRISREDLVRCCVWQVQNRKTTPEVTLFYLLIISHKLRFFSEAEGVSLRLKKSLYQQESDVSPITITAGILHEALLQRKESPRKAEKIFIKFKSSPGKLNAELVSYFLRYGKDKNKIYRQEKSHGIDNILASVNHFKALADQIRWFSFFISGYYIKKYDREGDDFNGDKKLLSVVKNMHRVLSETSGSISILNTKETEDILFGRVLLRYQWSVDSSQQVVSEWSLVLENLQGDEKTMDGFNSLPGLLAWCWLNRLVNHSTQISIDYPSHKIRQIDARHVLEVLMYNLDPGILTAIPFDAFEKPAHPLKSLLFLSVTDSITNEVLEDEAGGANDRERLAGIFCEQLTINSWGDVSIRQYSDIQGILQCLCEWLDIVGGINRSSDPAGESLPSLLIFSSDADSEHITQRISQVYAEIEVFFCDKKKLNRRFILFFGETYYVVSEKNENLQIDVLGDKKYLMAFLEKPVKIYQSTGIERLALAGQPLREIYQKNKINRLQVFYQFLNKYCYIWVLDERGSLWGDRVSRDEHEHYLSHWLYLFKNMSNRLKKTKSQGSDLPSLEVMQVSINPLGLIEFHVKDAGDLSSQKNFIELHLSIKSSGNGDQLNLNCDGLDFLYKDFRQNALNECMRHLIEKMKTEGRSPVFITDMDIPLALYGVTDEKNLQVVHVLKFKRNFERRINKILDG